MVLLPRSSYLHPKQRCTHIFNSDPTSSENKHINISKPSQYLHFMSSSSGGGRRSLKDNSSKSKASSNVVKRMDLGTGGSTLNCGLGTHELLTCDKCPEHVSSPTRVAQRNSWVSLVACCLKGLSTKRTHCGPATQSTQANCCFCCCSCRVTCVTFRTWWEKKGVKDCCFP